MLLETLPDPCGLFIIRNDDVWRIGKQRQLLALCQQTLRLLVEEETVEHGCQQTIERTIEYVDNHLLRIFIVFEVEHELLFRCSAFLLGL